MKKLQFKDQVWAVIVSIYCHNTTMTHILCTNMLFTDISVDYILKNTLNRNSRGRSWFCTMTSV